jgi:mono/diheme cytochrome c family protein
MNLIVVALSLMPLVQQPQSAAPTGDPVAGQRAFGGGAAFCSQCHGGRGQGGLGPDLAGRALSFEQFKRAITRPWGIMPSYKNLDDKIIADMHAFVEQQAKVAQPGPPGVPTPPDGSPLGQQIFIATGCGQCHRAEAADPRRDMGAFAKEMTYDLFAKIVYDGERRVYAVHTPPPLRMGVFSRERLPEPALRVIYDWLTKDTGLRVPMTAEVSAGRPEAGNTMFSISVENEGNTEKGLAAEDVSLSLVLPPGAQVVATTGSGYQGVRDDADHKGSIALWRVARVAAGQKVLFTITLAGRPTPQGLFENSTVEWQKPVIRRPAGQTLKDPRLPDKAGFSGDWISTTGISQRPDGQVLPLFVVPGK